ncbi:WecB/TagA/CpsF family glycosyltransferase [Neobacillus niacini]|uniref:WecB/TagA/CpsF family glycosyltransferase n=1 Tax=Neobacillus niacini TaxID=86668 RepID=UPI0039838934
MKDKKHKVKILNVFFDHITKSVLVNKLVEKVSQNQKTFLVTANPEIVMYANSDQVYSSVVKNADYTIPDGIGVIIASKMIGDPLSERIAGYDLLIELLKVGNEKGWSAYFLGAKKEVVEKAVHNVKTNYPHLKIAGWNDGYFDWASSHISDEIKEKKPDLIFVALGFPKQEIWISENIESFDKGLFMGVGGSFDVLAGEVKRAPVAWQKMNVEWLYRLIQQPSRWKRMLVLPQFVYKVFVGKYIKKSYE